MKITNKHIKILFIISFLTIFISYGTITAKIIYDQGKRIVELEGKHGKFVIYKEKI